MKTPNLYAVKTLRMFLKHGMFLHLRNSVALFLTNKVQVNVNIFISKNVMINSELVIHFQTLKLIIKQYIMKGHSLKAKTEKKWCIKTTTTKIASLNFCFTTISGNQFLKSHCPLYWKGKKEMYILFKDVLMNVNIFYTTRDFDSSRFISIFSLSR